MEVENQIASAWKTLYSLKQELTGTHYSLNNRIRLFHGTIAPTVLYGCEAWTMTQELENRIRRAQRQMLRMIAKTPRRRLAGNHDFEDGTGGNDASGRNDKDSNDSGTDGGGDVDSVAPS
eukprot:7846034-Pyramimonas_sp.AAC.1